MSWNEAPMDVGQLLDRDGLGFSSGALPQLVKTVKSTGEILSWPWVELSATPTPASADARIAAMKYLADVDAFAGRAIDPARAAAARDAREQYLRLEAAIEGDRLRQVRETVEQGRRLARMAGLRIDPDTGLHVIQRRSS